MTLRIPSSSVEYLSVPVESDAALDALSVHIAVIPPGSDPGASDWKLASWAGTNAVILIGPSQAIALAPATTYVVWVKVTSNPEIPVMRSGILQTL